MLFALKSLHRINAEIYRKLRFNWWRRKFSIEIEHTSRNCLQHSLTTWLNAAAFLCFGSGAVCWLITGTFYYVSFNQRERERRRARPLHLPRQQSQQHTVEGSTPHLSHILNLISFLVSSYIFIPTLQKKEWAALPPAGLRDHYSTWTWAHQRVAVSSSVSVESSVSLIRYKILHHIKTSLIKRSLHLKQVFFFLFSFCIQFIMEINRNDIKESHKY